MGKPKNPLGLMETQGAVMILTTLIVNAEKFGKNYVTVGELKAVKQGLEHTDEK